jgi:hypothetical protein
MRNWQKWWPLTPTHTSCLKMADPDCRGDRANKSYPLLRLWVGWQHFQDKEGACCLFFQIHVTQGRCTPGMLSSNKHWKDNVSGIQTSGLCLEPLGQGPQFVICTMKTGPQTHLLALKVWKSELWLKKIFFFNLITWYSFFVIFWNRGWLCSPGWPCTYDLPASASWVLGLQMFTTMPNLPLPPFFGSTVVWTQGLEFARQTLYHFCHTPALFALVIFRIESCIYIWSRSWSPYLQFPRSYLTGVPPGW